ncbi:error-prone DNA polymerase [Marinimicrobium alkaliphilum]|uniref:error-prone DNA polymerase n=1 Tax=Marinimicrobium alkaliphilum TaxID=2202654 RepID=UPI000DB97EE6|nr:error-prone DNA polymerase [Marinimicrobium alkaliphilum]
MAYAELFCQSNFSFLEGASHPEELIAQAAHLGYSALAITDECSVAGVVRAHTAMREQKLSIKLIVGSLLRLDALTLVALCPDRTAYAELCRVITRARRRSAKGDYQLDPWDIRTLKHCLLLWLPSGDTEADQDWATQLCRDHRTRLWIGCQRHLAPGEHHYQAHCEQLAHQWDLPISACGGVLMHSPARLPLQQCLRATRLGVTVADAGRALLANAERSLRTLHKLNRLFPATWIAQSETIAERCQFSLSELRYDYPAELVPGGTTPFEHLCALVEQGARKRFPEGVSTDIQTLIDKELGLIDELGYAHFFLTIHDLVMFAQQRNILYQGRGSAANSVVCYCLEITAVDPRCIQVLFERFISKERNEPPDIDVDFEHQRREEIIQYIYHKYGRERAALAATVICYRFKSAFKDIGKALGYPLAQLTEWQAQINRRDDGHHWQAQLADTGVDINSPRFQQFSLLVDTLRGFPRHLSQHVGGFVISAGPLHELVPVENASMAERTVIQWDKDDLESLGLLKVDVLALGMLSAIRRCFDLVRQQGGPSLTLSGITRAMDDPAVYADIQRADTVGVFQIESRAQMSMLPRLRPACYYDLVIQIAIVRPGPIQGGMVHPYLQRRRGEEAVDYPSDAVRGVLERTLGVPIFQEQVIQLAMVAAGFSGGEADQLRRAMARWKKNSQLTPFRDKLVNGMRARGYSLDFAERIFQQICGFGEYGFPESHSASFALLAYASAWLRHYYPAAFYCALLNSHPMGFYSPSQLVQDARRHDVTVLPVDINASDYEHSLTDRGELRLGFRLVSGLSREAAQVLVNARAQTAGGCFTGISALSALPLGQHNREALASAGALQSLSDNRYQARWQLMDDLPGLPLFQQQLAEEPGSYLPRPSELDNLVEDYAATGLTLNRHPIRILADADLLGHYTPAEALAHCRHKALVTVVGVVTGRQSPGTAGGVTFISLEDDTGTSNIVVWKATSRAQKSAFLNARLLKVHGIAEKEGEVIHIIAGRLEDISHRLSELQAKARDFH